MAAQVVLLSSPIPGQPLTASSNPSVDDEFVAELKSILSLAGSAHRLSRVERALPYELRAVEVGLATAVRAWEVEAIALEHRTRPTLRALLQKVSKLPHLTAAQAGLPCRWSCTLQLIKVSPSEILAATARMAAAHVRVWLLSESASADVTGRAGQAAELQGRQPEAPQPPQHRQACAPLLSTLHTPNPVNPNCCQPGRWGACSLQQTRTYRPLSTDRRML